MRVRGGRYPSASRTRRSDRRPPPRRAAPSGRGLRIRSAPRIPPRPTRESARSCLHTCGCIDADHLTLRAGQRRLLGRLVGLLDLRLELLDERLLLQFAPCTERLELSCQALYRALA